MSDSNQSIPIVVPEGLEPGQSKLTVTITYEIEYRDPEGQTNTYSATQRGAFVAERPDNREQAVGTGPIPVPGPHWPPGVLVVVPNHSMGYTPAYVSVSEALGQTL